MGQHNNSNQAILNPATLTSASPLAGTWPLNVSFVTPWIQVKEFDRLSFSMSTTAAGTAAGTVALRVSDFGFGSASSTYNSPNRINDLPTAAQGSVLTAVGTTATIAAAGTGYRVYDTQADYSWVRLEFTDTSGGANTGSVSIAYTQKSLSRA